MARWSEVSGDLFELGKIMSVPVLVISTHHMLQAVVYVILDQRFLGLLNGFFDGLQLLCNIDARAAFLQHGDHAGQVPVGTFESVDQCRMAGVNVGF
jgi:hypothetical protein